MEFLTELIGNILEALFSKFISSPRIPRPVRIAVCGVVCLPLAVIFFILAAQMESTVGFVFCGLLGLLMLGAFFLLFRRIMR